MFQTMGNKGLPKTCDHNYQRLDCFWMSEFT